MKKASFKRVIAQRKFALGAYIPPGHNAATAARHDVAPPPPPPARAPANDENFLHISADSFLDFISFNNMHTHREPYVLLERIGGTQESSNESEELRSCERAPETRHLRSRRPAVRTKPFRKLMARKTKKLDLRQRRKRPLERKYSTSDVEDERPLKYLKKIKPTAHVANPPSPQHVKTNGTDHAVVPQIQRRSRSPIRTRNIRISSKPSVRPPLAERRSLLRHRTSERIAQEILPTRPRRNKKSTVSPAPSNTSKPESVDVTSETRDTRSARKHKTILDFPETRKFIRSPPATRSQHEENIPSPIPMRDRSEESKCSAATRLQHLENIPSPISMRDRSEESKYSAETSSSLLKAEPITEITIAANIKQEPVRKHSNASSGESLYGPSGINEWVESIEPEFKEPYAVPTPCPADPANPVDPVDPANPVDPVDPVDSDNPADPTDSAESDEPASSSRRSSASPCPSSSLSTLKLVVSASDTQMKRLCKDCRHCTLIDKILEISALVQKPDDVYEFNENHDDVVAVPLGYKRRPRQRSDVCKEILHDRAHKRHSRPSDSQCQTHTLTNVRSVEVATAPCEEQNIYMDLLPTDSPHIIQLSSVPIPNSTKKIMRARLIAKSKANVNNDFSLVEHQNLLDQLLQTLKMSRPTNEEQPSNNENESQLDKVTGVGTRSAGHPNNEGPADIEPIARPADVEPSTTHYARTTRQAERMTQQDPPKKTFPKSMDSAKKMEAPTFYLTKEEFDDPIAFFEKIMPTASKFGICKVVAPSSFRPKCVIDDDIRFQATNQYIARMYTRWGPAAREMSAIRAHLATQEVNFNRAPLLKSMELNLPKLYQLVQRNGGLKQVMEKKRWSKVAEEMRFKKSPSLERALDKYYVKYLLPYDTLTDSERQSIITEVEKCWVKKYQKLLEWAVNPLHRQKKWLGESDDSEDEDETLDQKRISNALFEAEDCVVKGRLMNLSFFKQVAASAKEMLFPSPPTVTEAEREYWRIVLMANDHVCVNAASIDSGERGYGFSTNPGDGEAEHPWNLKMLSKNSGNVLRSLGGVLGVTVPTLHVGMMFSTSCFHRDPHALPWIEYMHEGPPKIWYGIPDEQSSNFRRAVETLCPTAYQNKSIWLPSDITMIPPKLLLEMNVSLSRVEQNPGEFVIVFPKAYSCSISTGYTVSESVYFATKAWLATIHAVFQEVRDSCEPTTFSLEQLLIALAGDERASLGVLHRAHASLDTVVAEELRRRQALKQYNIQRVPNAEKSSEECELCRSTMFLSKITGLTGKKSAVCLQHGLQLLEKGKEKYDMQQLRLHIFYTKEQLKKILENVTFRLYD